MEIDRIRRTLQLGIGIIGSETVAVLLAEYDRRGAEIERLRAAQCNALCSDIEHERDQLRQQRRAALALADEVDEETFSRTGYVDTVDLRAALGAADEPTTGGGS